ncbi:hypothetical protein [Actinacidiphila yeochonensis]|uniref:hypothetical protein n=1 Tax=Actinacidiphila yeochonensis TaxID=89050 RepID=UPI000B2D26BE|nr:hypothetical protein [Actinacidiphila yeochonensis]
MADNPRRAWLQQLLSSMDTDLDAMRPVLDRPARDFGRRGKRRGARSQRVLG